MPFGLPSVPSFHHAVQSISLKTRSSAVISLADFTAPSVPTFYANPLLWNGHLQTCYTSLNPADPYDVYYARKHVINHNDGGHFAVDFVVDKFDDPACEDLPIRTKHMTAEEASGLGSDDEKPMLVGMHGLSGGSYEIYLRAVLAPLVTKESGFAACVVNARGCAMSKITTQQLFNARFTEDIREATKYLKKIYPNRPLFIVGFSLGANILTNVRSYLQLNLSIYLLTLPPPTVPGGRRRKLCFQSSCSMLEPLEPGTMLQGSAPDVHGEDIFQGHGRVSSFVYVPHSKRLL